ncbi:hypothetical protein M422DRAFT_245837 [Sphaerobolus stellatus SS14]|nr:hypothetical protein M422DRAFT_245837 [Sphaerobolus stellatus SS14]
MSPSYLQPRRRVRALFRLLWPLQAKYASKSREGRRLRSASSAGCRLRRSIIMECHADNGARRQRVERRERYKSSAKGGARSLRRAELLNLMTPSTSSHVSIPKPRSLSALPDSDISLSDEPIQHSSDDYLDEILADYPSTHACSRNAEQQPLRKSASSPLDDEEVPEEWSIDSEDHDFFYLPVYACLILVAIRITCLKYTKAASLIRRGDTRLDDYEMYPTTALVFRIVDDWLLKNGWHEYRIAEGRFEEFVVYLVRWGWIKLLDGMVPGAMYLFMRFGDDERETEDIAKLVAKGGYEWGVVVWEIYKQALSQIT